MSDGITDAKHIGRGVIDGVECEHLAFRTPDVDWQLWVQMGDRPFPRRYVITSKAVTAAPQYTVEILSWRTEGVAANTFTFSPPAGAGKIKSDQLWQIDEVPAGTVVGGGRR
jgi:hypothetical protein